MTNRIRCYFDMFDNCVGYDIGNVSMNMGCGFQMVDSGVYDFPIGYNPIGKSATDLYMYSATSYN